jgi:hypothetical protein
LAALQFNRIGLVAPMGHGDLASVRLSTTLGDVPR